MIPYFGPFLLSASKSHIAPLVGFAALTTGLVDAGLDRAAADITAPLNILSGGVVLVLYLLGRSALHIGEKWMVSNGEKLVGLPTPQELANDKKSLFEKLEAMGKAADAERHEMASFREQLAATLADYGARIKSLEGRA